MDGLCAVRVDFSKKGEGRMKKPKYTYKDTPKGVKRIDTKTGKVTFTLIEPKKKKWNKKKSK